MLETLYYTDNCVICLYVKESGFNLPLPCATHINKQKISAHNLKMKLHATDTKFQPCSSVETICPHGNRNLACPAKITELCHTYPRDSVWIVQLKLKVSTVDAVRDAVLG